MTKNIEYEIGNVIIRITNLGLWKYWKKTNVVPCHKFHLEIWNHEGEKLFEDDVLVRSGSMDFEFRESAQVCIFKALKLVDTQLIPQSSYEQDKFPMFIEKFNVELNKIVEYGNAVCSLF